MEAFTSRDAGDSCDSLSCHCSVMTGAGGPRHQIGHPRWMGLVRCKLLFQPTDMP